MTYINQRGPDGVETVDEFSTYKEARAMIAEYRMAFPASSGELYLSSRSTRDWRERNQPEQV